MISEVFSGESFLIICFLQSVVFVLLGLAGSYLFRKRAARAHRVLFLSMVAAVIVPGLSMLVKYYGLGLFVDKVVVVSEVVVEEPVLVNEYEPVVVERGGDFEYEAKASDGYLVPVVAAPEARGIEIDWRAVFCGGGSGLARLWVFGWCGCFFAGVIDPYKTVFSFDSS